MDRNRPNEKPGRTRGAPGARRRGSGGAKRNTERAPTFQGWRTSDAEEIERRRWRGRTEIIEVEALEAAQPLFGSFRVRSASGGDYEVEIRSLDGFDNSCGCADHRVNGLGTCKHIEGVLSVLRKNGARAFAAAARAGSPRVEVFVPRTGEGRPRILWPKDAAAAAAARSALADLLGPDRRIEDESPEALEAFSDSVAAAGPGVRAHIRVSHYLPAWIAETRRRAAREKARAQFLADVEAGRRPFDPLRHALLPYQREGMLHLAFGERALLADDMGLGKTIQAIAACALLRRLRGIGRVLVVSPASLKGEWQDQIARFSGADTLLVAGGRPARLAAYARPGFFTLVNYEQVLIDAADINRLVKPDVVILDEAQRIKNWQTKTARAVKSIDSPYAFVLTGTPLENRIDEIYSIVQYLDPELLGPLFRFNRDFYQLDERGRPVDYKNLGTLSERLRPILLRRRKRDVESELPGRTVTNYFLALTDEQRVRYDEYRAQASRLVHLAQRRPLTRDEFERLQRLLACMRMICDTPYILDPGCRESPKIEELERLLPELLAEPARKIIVFSEWQRMLELARELALDMGLEFAWHTGSVPQARRRAEIARFKRDPGCRLLLSTDSGSVGLNLQAASAVVNLDLPWNPARLEQRIARAWRKNQTRHVDVINLVAEDSIEHNMLHLLAQKQALADGVLDGAADLKALRMPSGRRAFVERIAAVMTPVEAEAGPSREPAAVSTVDGPQSATPRDDLATRLGDRLLLLQVCRGDDGRERLLAVLEGDADEASRERERLVDGATEVEVVDHVTYETIGRLVAAGLMRMTGERGEVLVRSPRLAASAAERAAERARECVGILAGAERKLRMAQLLLDGGFAAEAAPVLTECLDIAARARAVMNGTAPPAEPDEATGPAPGGATDGSMPSPAPGPEQLAAIVGSVDHAVAEVRRGLFAATPA